MNWCVNGWWPANAIGWCFFFFLVRQDLSCGNLGPRLVCCRIRYKPNCTGVGPITSTLGVKSTTAPSQDHDESAQEKHEYDAPDNSPDYSPSRGRLPCQGFQLALSLAEKKVHVRARFPNDLMNTDLGVANNVLELEVGALSSVRIAVLVVVWELLSLCVTLGVAVEEEVVEEEMGMKEGMGLWNLDGFGTVPMSLLYIARVSIRDEEDSSSSMSPTTMTEGGKRQWQ